ncbi:MAG TPA: LysR substrate-binding domain-containing protein, partial [Ramlibacter sp.]
LPQLAAALREEAPQTRVSNISVAAGDVATALETREIDCAVGILQPRHRGVQAELLFREQYVAITAAGWRPATGRAGASLSRAQLAGASMVLASPTATFHSSVEQMLVSMKLADRIMLRGRHFGALPDVVTRTDLLAIVPSMYAAALAQREIRVWKLPDAPFYDVRLVWHASTARDPAQQWLRALLHRLFRRPVRAAAA